MRGGSRRSRGAQNRTVVYFNRGYDVVDIGRHVDAVEARFGEVRAALAVIMREAEEQEQGGRAQGACRSSYVSRTAEEDARKRRNQLIARQTAALQLEFFRAPRCEQFALVRARVAALLGRQTYSRIWHARRSAVLCGLCCSTLHLTLPLLVPNLPFQASAWHEADVKRARHKKDGVSLWLEDVFGPTWNHMLCTSPI